MNAVFDVVSQITAHHYYFIAVVDVVQCTTAGVASVVQRTTAAVVSVVMLLTDSNCGLTVLSLA